MKLAIIDTNNVSNIGFYQAKGILIKEMKLKLKEAEEQNMSENLLSDLKNQLKEKISKSLNSFSIQIFLNMIHSYFKKNKGRTFIFVWDGKGGSKWRKEVYPKYKSNRDHSQEEHYPIFIDSMADEKKLLEKYPVIQIKDIEVEADDLIYNLCEIFADDDVKVISGDSDFIQLPQKFNKTKVWNPRTKKNFKIPEYDYVTYKSIVGDNSDCIDGLYLYGPKKAEKTIANNFEKLTEEQLQIIKDNKKIIDLALNPFVEKNKQIVNEILSNSKISLDLENIKKLFFKFKLKSFMIKWDNTAEILKQLKKESIYEYNGDKRC